VADQNLDDQWSSKALDTIDTVVATVNDKAVRPAIVAARGVVFVYRDLSCGRRPRRPRAVLRLRDDYGERCG